MKQENINGLMAYEAPAEWQEFASENGIKRVYFIYSKKLENSYHFNRTIYVNIRDDKWKNYCKIVRVRSYEEAMTCKFLHEVGHIVHKHRYISFKSQLRIIEYDFEIAIEKVSLIKIFEDCSEKEAWCYVFDFRECLPLRYVQLINAFKNWYCNFRHCF